MARFTFRLEPVLRHRERLENQKQVILAAALRDLQLAELERDRLRDRRAALADELSLTHRDLDVETLRTSYAHLEFLARAIADCDERVAACAAEAMRARTVLIAAAQDHKVMTMLKARKREVHEAEELQIEQRELDDANARRHGRAVSEKRAGR